MSEQVRYSDADLLEFKTLIEQKIKDAEKDLKHFQGQLDHSGDNSGDESGSSTNMMEGGSEALSKEKISQLAHRQKKFIQGLNGALVRIRSKTYGVCRETGKLISKERLKIVPHTTLSIEAKNMMDQK